MLDSLLTPEKLNVICALSSGATVTNAAAEAGIHRNTIANWRRNDLAFHEALAQAQYDRALLVREKMEALAPLAIHTLRDLLVDPKTPATVRLKAALAILQTATTPPAQLQPNVHKSAQPEPQPQPDTPPEPHREPENAADPIRVHSCSFVAQNPAPPVHNDAQRHHTKIGRNELCPCGSGAKYKRCCLNKSAQPAQAAA